MFNMLRMKGLKQQGYTSCSLDELQNISNGLRFTPTVCMIAALYGLYTMNPFVHYVLAALGIIPFWFEKVHPVDVLYNKVVRHMVKGNALPPNPLPRRIACLIGGLTNLLIALSMVYMTQTTAYIIGGVLVCLQLIMITTHYCLASAMYVGYLRLIGKYEEVISVAKAKALLKKDAVLLDVRSASEHAAQRIDQSINVPLEKIKTELAIYNLNRPIILYCNSGNKSAQGKRRLEKIGYKNVHDLGAMERWIA